MSTFLKLFTLLYADDTIILAESENNLQDALNALEEYCSIWALSVNLDKSKIIIFSRGCIRKYKNFTFAGEKIEVVREYVYLGVTMTYNNKFTSAIERQLTLGRKAYFSLLSKIQKFKLPLDIQYKLFDQLVVPIITYGCEVWGHVNLDKIEMFHKKFIKNSLKVSKFTANSVVYGESGRQKLINVINIRMLNYWLKVNQGNQNKLSSILFKFMKKLHDSNILTSQWCKKIHGVLNNLGLSYIWGIDGLDINPNQFRKIIKQRMSDISIQDWLANINENPLCTIYILFKESFGFENYLNIEDKYRIPLTKYRCGSHSLPISDRRYNAIDERNICPLCNLDTGDEFHYILVCPAFENKRKLYIPSYFFNRPNVIKFRELFALKGKIRQRKLSEFVRIILNVFRIDSP